jgi:GcrA cell cycle regulator
MRDTAWNDEKIALLKRLWGEGETANAIGARLGGLSRSAVLGKVFRLRLGASIADTAPAPQKIANESGAASRVRPPRLKAKAGMSARPAVQDDSPGRRRRGSRQERTMQQQAARKRGKALLELTNNCCRWPIGRPGTARFFFCGAPEADLERGMPYCARHMRRAYRADALVVVVEPRRVVSRAA